MDYYIIRADCSEDKDFLKNNLLFELYAHCLFFIGLDDKDIDIPHYSVTEVRKFPDLKTAYTIVQHLYTIQKNSYFSIMHIQQNNNEYNLLKEYVVIDDGTILDSDTNQEININ